MENEVLSVYRSENKYLLPFESIYDLKSKLGKILKIDNNSQTDGYLVRSLYFDSLNNIDFNTKMAGTEIRKKIRLRIYDLKSNKCKLEMKQKNGNLQHKISLWITKEDALELINKNYSVLIKYFNTSKEALTIYTTMVLGCYQPVVMVEYDRIAYTHPLYETRITLDMNIRSSETNFNLFDQNISYYPVFDQNAILEVKYNGNLLNFISNSLKQFHLTKIAFSKYCLARKVYQYFDF